MQSPPGWIVPAWPAPRGVEAACSTRLGGASRPPYDSLNLGDHVGDSPADVARNRATYAEALGAHPVFMKQVHGWGAAHIDADSADGIEADICVTAERRVACTIMVADCMPVLFALRDAGAVAAAHAGWRGLAGEGGRGVIECAWEQLRDANGGRPAPSDVLAWLGPCIGPEAFEVGEEVKQAFEASDAGAAACFRVHAPGKYLADLPALARRRLAALGITSVHGNDGSAPWCTVGNPSIFFSHRRDRVSGRFAASVWLA
ncbi:peptidoglycan editing factor PgeF [Caenimonas aquaedulcis]|uniref:Purine nucleoside phosphorylase n=1 Tax=Caenimonas aquaedulcis TaxID=2793270 RepID=A0A931MFD6_9BURK|nr:peptidoglycan editing factor PgeF [Caenimonas aquaedulcis]MBG9387213.1 peptidoglycan editing factor PgeF [Caenimonas aquaedulcis]